MVNVPVKRSSKGELVDDSDLDRYQSVISDVQRQFTNYMMPINKQIEEVPITLRTNMLLLFPSLNSRISPEMT